MECGLTTKDTRMLRGDQIEVFKILNGFENVDCNIQTRGYERTPIWKVNYTNDLAPFVN